LLDGVIKFGIPATILCKLIRLSSSSDSTLDGELPKTLNFSSYYIDIISCLIMGFCFGLLNWNRNEKEYLLRKDEITKSEEESNKTRHY